MCRILALTCSSCRLCTYEIQKVIDAFVKASRLDPRLEYVSDGRRRSHDDGWGVAVAFRKGERVGVLYERMGIPVFSRASRYVLKQLVKYLTAADEAIAVIHSRAASLGEPLGTEAAHPYRYEVEVRRERVTVFFAHNGAADKDRLCEELALPKHSYTDSYALGLHIARSLERAGILEPREVAKLVLEAVSRYCVKDGKRRGGVTTTLVVRDSTAFAIATSWFDESNPKSVTYYQPYIATYGKLHFFASPTVIDALGGDVGAKALASGRAVLITFGSLEELEL